MPKKLKFNKKNQTDFLSTLKKRVDLYFSDKEISKHANPLMVFKTVFFLSLTLGLYLLIITSAFSLLISLFLAIVLGMSMAFVGFNVCHDALHGAYSRNKNVNKSLGFIFNIIGANPYVWKLTHNVVHHSYTNIVNHDEDIEIAPGLIRVHESDKYNSFQRFQHIYAFFLYTLTTLSWFFRKDYLKFFKKEIGSSHTNKHPKIEYFNLFFYKLVYYFLFIILPLLVIDLSWWQFLIGYLAMNFAESLVLGLVFQLAHVVENTEITEAGTNNLMEDSWAVHQLKTTANFSARSSIAAFLCGGLNMQVEHHLFPRICHVHYPQLSVIVQQTAEDFDLPYHSNKTFGAAIKSHYYLLKRLGKRPLAA